MATHAAFIRAIMLGRGGVSREGLLRAFARAGARSPQSHLATGNVTFDADEAAVAGIAAAVQRSLLRMAGTDKRVFVRSLDDLRGLAALDPFADADGDAHELCVSFLPPGTPVALELPFTSPRGDMTVLHATRDAVFSETRLVEGRPGPVGAWLERRLGVPVTSRNWNTVERVLRLG